MSVMTGVAADYQVSEPARDPRSFRTALGQYGTGVAAITTMSNGSPVGMTVNSFASVSLDPPLILWSVQNGSGRAPAFLEAGHFAVNVLSATQVDISRTVASPAERETAFTKFAWTEGLGGAPLIDGAIARFECRVAEILPGGDHQILIGQVERCSVMDGEPLLFVQGGYATSAPFSAPAPAETTPAAAPTDQEPAPFAQLVTAVNHRLSVSFDEHRSRFGLSAAGSRVLKRLSTGPHTPEELGELAFLGPQAIEDALSELLEAGLIETIGPGFRRTATGQAVREQVAENARRFNEAALAGLPETDVAAAYRVLGRLADETHPLEFHHTKENAE